MILEKIKLAIVGLGYVGLPLALEFGKKRPVYGFDINDKRIDELKIGKDSTLECSSEEILSAVFLNYTTRVEDLAECNCYIITVPTPIDKYKNPDLSLLIRASQMIGKLLNKGDLVIYESTVYPGATEEICVPVLEKNSGLKFNQDFYCGYSPERINPGDKEHRLVNIKKITSGSTPEIATLVDDLYQDILLAGTYRAESIKVAEAAKVIENTQRDLNIALINELAIIFNTLGIDTKMVLNAAASKWNFLPFTPGLVGGHCIGVDPYYLTHKCKEIGYTPEIILAGRRINDGMAKYISWQLINAMIRKGIAISGSRILIMGFVFKPNCPDIRNTKVFDIVGELEDLKCIVDIYDPWALADEVKNEYGLSLINSIEPNKYDAIVLAVEHDNFRLLKVKDIRSFGKEKHVFYDLKHVFNIQESDLRL